MSWNPDGLFQGPRPAKAAACPARQISPFIPSRLAARLRNSKSYLNAIGSFKDPNGFDFTRG